MEPYAGATFVSLLFLTKAVAVNIHSEPLEDEDIHILFIEYEIYIGV